VISGAGSPGQQVCALQHHLLHGRPLDRLWPHAQHRPGQGQQVDGVLHAAWRLRLAQKGQQFAHLAQLAGRGALNPVQRHPHRHPLDRAEQVGQAGNV